MAVVGFPQLAQQIIWKEKYYFVYLQRDFVYLQRNN